LASVNDEAFDDEEDHMGEGYRDIKLSVCRESSSQTHINFIPFIYQERNNILNNKFLIYDIIKNKIEPQMSCNPGQRSM